MQIPAGFIALALIIASASAANQIKCFTCTSDTSESCNDPIKTDGDDGQKSFQCTNDVTNKILGGLNTGLKGLGNWLGLEKTPQVDVNFACMKSTYTRTLEDGKEKKHVVRSCVIEGTKICEELNKDANTKQSKNFFCEECKGDECNGSTSVIATPLILLSTIAILLASH